MIEFIGTLGLICLALSGIPQMIKSIMEGHSNGMADGTIWFWIIGEISMLIYAKVKYTKDYILILNYLANVIIVGIICWYKYFPR